MVYKQFMNIKQASHQCGVPERYIRFLIKEKTLIPAKFSTTRGVPNDLSDANIIELLFIKELRAVGIELFAIGKILKQSRSKLRD